MQVAGLNFPQECLAGGKPMPVGWNPRAARDAAKRTQISLGKSMKALAADAKHENLKSNQRYHGIMTCLLFSQQRTLEAIEAVEGEFRFEFEDYVSGCAKLKRGVMAVYCALSAAQGSHRRVVTLVGEAYVNVFTEKLVQDHDSGIYNLPKTWVALESFTWRFEVTLALVSFLVRTLHEAVAEQVQSLSVTNVTDEIAWIIRNIFHRSDATYVNGLQGLNEENEKHLDTLTSYVASLCEKADGSVEFEKRTRGVGSKRWLETLPSLYQRWLLGCGLLYTKSLKSGNKDQ